MKVFVSVIIILLILGVGWLSTCGVIYLVTLCFGLEFSWLIATGIWLVICLLKSFTQNINNRKD